MESKEESFDDILWNKYDNIQKQLDENQAYYQNLIKFCKEELNEMERHEFYLNSIFKGTTELKKFTKLNEIIKLFNLGIQCSLDNHKKFIGIIILNLEKYITKIKQINPIYIDFKQYLENYTSQKKKLIKTKDKFHESVSFMEKKILSKIQEASEKQENNPNEISTKLKKEVINEHLKKYQTNIEQINKKRIDFISKQKNLINLYVELEELNIDIYYTILDNFLILERVKKLEYLNNSKFVKLQKELKEKDIKKEAKEYFKSIKANDKDSEKNEILFEGYKSKIDFDKCNTSEDINNFAKAVDIIDKDFKDFFDGTTLEKEKSKNKIRNWTKKFFELDKKNIDFDKESMEKYYYSTLKFPYTHNSFLKIITDLRSISDFNKNKQLIDLLGEAFKIILAEAKINNDFHNAKNCLILSQTFYYLDNDQKIYASEYLKKDSWLTEKNFWIGFGSYMIDEELKKLAKSNSELNYEDIEKNKKYPEKLCSKIDNVLFSQLCALIKNIIYFMNNSSLVIEIIEKFKEKYSYLTEKNIALLKIMISSEETAN